MDKQFSTTLLSFFVLVFTVLATPGCGDNGVVGSETGSIHASPGQVAFAQIDVGESDIETLQLRNMSESEVLEIYSVELSRGDDGHVEQLEIVDKPDLTVQVEPQEFVEVDIEYAPTVDAPTNQGELLVRNSDPDVENNTLAVPVHTLGNDPEFFADPGQVRFQRMQPGQDNQQQLRITNIGNGPMTIFEEPTYSGGEDFQLGEIDGNFPVELLPYDSEGVQDNPEDYVYDLDVIYAPMGDGAETGQIQFVTDDVDDPPAEEGETQVHEVDVLADAEAPCIEVDGRTRDFGQVPIGETAREQFTVTNCGTESLDISDVRLQNRPDDEPYGLELGPWDQNNDGSIDNTVSIQPDQTEFFHVAFTPVEEGTRRADLEILSNDPIQPVLEINMTARGAHGSCPEAIATARVDGTPMEPAAAITAAPLDTIVLDGTDSTDDEGNIIDWNWEVLQDPPGITTELEEVEDDGSMMEFQPLTAGEYRIGLEVLDDTGFHSCERAEVEIFAIPDQSIHVELTWSNPADPGVTDDGSDMDVHLAKMGPGTWFDNQYSVYFQNPNEDEEPIWNPEDPSLDIDIRDGEGPENITMDTPDHCQWYAVGAHYYDDNGFGTAYNTIRIYIDEQLRYERPYFPLEQTGEFWDIARIHWNDHTSEATIIGVDDHYPIAPVGDEPTVTQDMINSELCTAEELY